MSRERVCEMCPINDSNNNGNFQLRNSDNRNSIVSSSSVIVDKMENSNGNNSSKMIKAKLKQKTNLRNKLKWGQSKNNNNNTNTNCDGETNNNNNNNQRTSLTGSKTSVTANMDTAATGSGLMEEYELMKQAKYRLYMTNIDKALKNFEYSSEWADLISALGKLNKVISSSSQYQIIPRRIKISKRLAQCMHPALPSGVHLKALETYDVIFNNTGVERLASELFIYSAGLFPLLGYAAMNVRPTLLRIYENYFVPLGERLRPALSGFLSGVLPGLEAGLDHYERTNSLLGKVCVAVSPIYFYTCLWECVATNASIRLPAITYVLEHFNKRLNMADQRFLMGTNVELMMSGLCACLNDTGILVQRNTLEFLLLGFPMHTELLTKCDLIKLVTNSLNTILRRDMSLNRRLYSWLLGTELTNSNRNFSTESDSKLDAQNLSETNSNGTSSPTPSPPTASYFSQYSKFVLIKALKCTLKTSLHSLPVDLKPYRILVSLLDKVEIGPDVLDHVLCDVIRTMSLSNGNIEVTKSANLLFATFAPYYIWNYMTQLYEKACKTNDEEQNKENKPSVVDSGEPNLCEVCSLTEFLLETISLEMYNETTRVYLPQVLLAITQMLTIYSKNLTDDEVTASLKLCIKIVSRVQPMITSPSRIETTSRTDNLDFKNTTATSADAGNGLEKSKSDSKINQTSLDDEPIKRSNSNQSMGKKSPKKTKKSKSYSKLLELDKEICTDTGQLLITSSAISTPNLEVEVDKKNRKTSPTTKLKNKLNKQKNNNTSNSSIGAENTPDVVEEVEVKLNKINESGDSDKAKKEESITTTPEEKTDEIMKKPKLQDETTLEEYTILEKCIKQYEIFYQIYVSNKILQCDKNNNKVCNIKVNLIQDHQPNQQLFNNDVIVNDDNTNRHKEVDQMFNTLRINRNCRLDKLETLLNKSISQTISLNDLNDEIIFVDTKNVKLSSSLDKLDDCDKSLNISHRNDNEIVLNNIRKLITVKLNDSLRNAIKLSSSLLVEMSTFPNYNQNLIIDHCESDIPLWLKVLTLVASYTKGDKELQVSTISTLFDLITLLKSQREHLHSPHITSVVMLPLMKISHVNYLETQTRTFQVLTSLLWDYLDDKTIDLKRITTLLYDLHTCLDSGLVETVIGNRIANAHLVWSKNVTDRNNRIYDYTYERLSDIRIMCTPPTQSLNDCNETLSENSADGFKKFELLWHLGRDYQNKKGFDKTLLKMYDNLTLPYHISIRTFVTKWLHESLLRGDLGRLFKPLLKIVLVTNSRRIGIVHAPLNRETNIEYAIWDCDRVKEEESTGVVEKDIYAVSSEDGNVRYHMEISAKQKRSPIRSLHKKFFGVALGGRNMNNSNKPNNFLDKSMSVSENNSNISLIINPLENTSDLDSAEHDDYVSLSSSAPTQIITDCDKTESGDAKDAVSNYSSLKDVNFTGSSESDSFSDTDSEKRENSLEKDFSITTDNSIEPVCVKKFTGDCDRVAEKLTKHDRTKNRKTYYLAKNGAQYIEKLEFSLNAVSDGQLLDESSVVVAEDYFNSTVVETQEYIGDTLISESNDINCDTNNSENNFQASDIHKRLSNTSKTSSDGANTNRNSSNESASEIENESLETVNSTDTLVVDDAGGALVKETLNPTNTSPDQPKKKKSNLKKISQHKASINWEQTQEKMEKSKLNSEILRKNANDDLFSLADRKKFHPYHNQILLYYSVFDTKQVLYAFQTLRNIISCDCRMFLCLSITTSLSISNVRQLLVRHRKSVFGKDFSGPIANTEFNTMYRSCMYLEAIVTICLYYSRSYFPKEMDSETNQIPTLDDIKGNCKIQLASIELLTMLFTEMIAIVKEMGKNFANYVADLMGKCKVQKIILHCLISSVHSFNVKNGTTYSEQIIAFNDPGPEKLHAESIQLQLLRLMLTVVKLEYEVLIQKGEETIKDIPQSSPTRTSVNTQINAKYLTNCPISQQPLFLTAVLTALKADNLKHLHKNWTDLITSCLGCFTFGSLTNIVISVVHQLCTNIEKISSSASKSNLPPPDYAMSQLEALTVLCHYCLLDHSQQDSLSHIFNPQTTSSTQQPNPGQIFNNLIHVFLSNTHLSQALEKNTQITAARNAVLSHLPRIIASVAGLWETEIGQSRLVKQQLLEFLSPISLSHGMNFLAAIAVAWQGRGDCSRKIENYARRNSTPPTSLIVTNEKSLPQAYPEQLFLVKLVSGIRVMPMDSFIQTLNQVIKSPPPIHNPPSGLLLEVCALELFYFYMKDTAAVQLSSDSWSSLLALLKDGLNLSPPAQFVLLAILNEFVQRCPQMPFQDKKDLRDLHDITSRLVDALSLIAGSCLEQTTWLRRNLAVKEDTTSLDGSFNTTTTPLVGNQQYSVQAQTVLAQILATLLDVAYGSQEKDKVVTIVTTLMYNIVPYLKNHTVRNIPSFYACSNLLASVCEYQYTRKAWRKDVLDLLLDSSFFQMDSSCLKYWIKIVDSLMTYDNTTFKDLLNRVPLAQTGSLNIFTSKEQEYEQRALLLKRLAFVIFCSDLDQYHKSMPEIQEQLANSLRLPQVVPSIQAAVFLCFRVLLLKMSPDHVTSLWPIIIAEMVQVFLAIEQELKTDTEEFSQHIRMLSGLDSQWVTNSNNGLHSHGHPHWRMVQLETAKLLELGCVLPATNLPHFQMYRWAFVGSQHEFMSDLANGDCNSMTSPQLSIAVFIPHVTRIARLMDFRYTSHSPKNDARKGNHLVLTCQSISNLQDLYGFFSSLSVRWPTNYTTGDAENDYRNCLEEIEGILANDFLEKMPTNMTTAR